MSPAPSLHLHSLLAGPWQSRPYGPPISTLSPATYDSIRFSDKPGSANGMEPGAREALQAIKY